MPTPSLTQCTVLQMVAAAPGWHARYTDGSRTNLCAVALWALVEDDSGTGKRIVGIAPGGDGGMSGHAEEMDKFDGYVFVSPSMTAVPGSRGQ